MPTTHRSELVDKVTNALMDEAYDGSMGPMSETEFPRHVLRLAETATEVFDDVRIADLIAEARSEGEWCCEIGCGSGACETCPCCSAGWCVSGRDGVPEDLEDRQRWLEVAAEHNPVAAALRARVEAGADV